MFTDLYEEMQLEFAKAYIRSKGQCAGAFHILKVRGIGDLNGRCQEVCPSGRHHCMTPPEMLKWATDFVAEAEKKRGYRKGRSSGKTMLICDDVVGTDEKERREWIKQLEKLMRSDVLSSIPLVSTSKKEDSMEKWEEGMINTDRMHYWQGHYYEGPTISGVPAETIYGRRGSVASKTTVEGLEFISAKPIISREDLRMEILNNLKVGE